MESETAPQAGNNRGGSHVLVVGSENNYSSYGWIVVGFSNVIGARCRRCAAAPATGPASVVAGGSSSMAEGISSAVFGGNQNQATGDLSLVVGGLLNSAEGLPASSVHGGHS